MSTVVEKSETVNATRPKAYTGLVFGTGLWSGMRVQDYLRLLWRNRFAVHPTRYPMAAFLLPISVANTALSALQHLIFQRQVSRTRVEQPPVFIIGHFRTGTTHMFELLSRDDRFAYPTTYECFAATHFLLTSAVVPKLVWFALPKQRPMDRMAFGLDHPQEEEFALIALGAPTMYYRIAFPDRPPPFMETLTMSGISDKDRERWTNALNWFVQAQSYRKKKRLVLKSPAHTGRIATIAKLFPGAKFIHLVRNPYEVFASLKNSWQVLDGNLGFQIPRHEQLDEFILSTFELMYDAFEQQRNDLEPGQICDVHYEELVRDPLAQMQIVYDRLDLGDFGYVRPKLDQYLSTLKDYTTNPYEIDPHLQTQIDERWAEYIRKYGY